MPGGVSAPPGLVSTVQHEALQSEAWQAWIETLHILAVYPRKALLRDITALAPFWLALIPEPQHPMVLSSVVAPIQAVARWWP